MSRPRVTLDWKTDPRGYLLELTCCLGLMIGVPYAAAQEGEGGGRPADRAQATFLADKVGDTDCRRCHSCARPTPEYKCLLSCNRDRIRQGETYLPDHQGPEVVILNELEKAYLPVPFDHKGHARMAEMAQGCVTCHHYTPEGRQHPACKTCHDISSAGTDIYKPGLKGAYHQQCLNCHRDWIDETDCDICHRPKTGRPLDGDPVGSPTKDDILGQMHPPIPEPDTEIYGARSEPPLGSVVVFRHQEHVERFGFRCVECHHEPSCARCHIREPDRTRPRTLAEHHRPCIRCHKRDMSLAGRNAGKCEDCHWLEGQPKPEPFDHASTGWPLSRFHQGQSCRACHLDVPFVGLNNDCNACHSDWSPAVFDHQVTGQVLDENHAEHDCEVCHVGRRFDSPPRCDECHDEEEEGIAFPAKRPGPSPEPHP